MSENCSHSGESVAPGSGRFVNCIPDLNNPEDRKADGRPCPDCDFICYECSDNASNSPAAFADQLRYRLLALGRSPDEAIYRVTWEDVITVLSEKLAEEGVTPDEIDDAYLPYLLDKGKEGAESLPWHDHIAIMIDDGWSRELAEPAFEGTGGDDWLEAAFEDCTCQEE